jgi:hypothetical protein
VLGSSERADHCPEGSENEWSVDEISKVKTLGVVILEDGEERTASFHVLELVLVEIDDQVDGLAGNEREMNHKHNPPFSLRRDRSCPIPPSYEWQRRRNIQKYPKNES